MSVKQIAFTIFVLGVILLAIFFLYESKKRRKDISGGSPTKSENLHEGQSVHDLFIDDAVASQTMPAHDPYEGYVADKYLINRKQSEIYARLENLIAGDFRVSPKVRINDVIRPEKSVLELDPDRAEKLNSNFNNARFDFVITNIHTGRISGVVMAEHTLKTIPCGDFIVKLLDKLSMPLFRYPDSEDISDDELSNRLYELFEDGKK